MSANPDAAEEASPLLILPSRWFFSDVVPCPEHLTHSQVRDLAHLTLEGRSPFPEEKLAIAYRRYREAGKLVVVATLKDRIPPTGANVRLIPHIVPDVLLTLPDDEGDWRWIATRDGMTAVKLEDGVPVEIHGFAGAPSDEPRILSQVQALAARRVGIPSAGAVFKLLEASLSRKPEGLALTWEASGTERRATTLVRREDLDTADVRADDVVARLRRDAANARRISRTFTGLGITALLLLLAQASLWVAAARADGREERLESRRARVEAVEAQASLLETLGKVTDRRTPQLEWLAAMNLTRPDSVWLRRLAVSEHGVTASGNSRSMESLNGWLASLRRDKEFTEVSTPRITTSGQLVAFELRIVPAKTPVRREAAR